MFKHLKVDSVLAYPSTVLLREYLDKGYEFKHTRYSEFTLVKGTSLKYPYRCLRNDKDYSGLSEVSDNPWTVTKTPIGKIVIKGIYHV